MGWKLLPRGSPNSEGKVRAGRDPMLPRAFVDARTHAQATAPQIFSSGAPLQPFPSLNIS
jgi:hypothetical protein